MQQLFTLVLICFANFLFAQSPKDLNADVGQGSTYWFNNVSGNTDIETTFNNARRAEETQLSLTTNSLGSLILPANWSSYDNDSKVLYLLNEERTCRGGVNYGSGAVLGMPLTGVESNMDVAAEAHASDQISNGTFSHDGSNGSTFSQRIDAAVGGTCNEFMSYGENLAAYWSFGGSNSFVAEHAIYDWIYEDNGSTWGHRRACLIQDADDYNATGFTDDFGVNGNEGFIGVGFASSTSWDPFSFGGVTDGDIVVLNFFDPVSTASCNYNILVGTNNLIDEQHPILAYPNPTSHELFLEGVALDSKITLINNIGKAVLVQTADADLLTLNVSNLPAGLYFIQIQSRQTSVIKVLINN